VRRGLTMTISGTLVLVAISGCSVYVGSSAALKTKAPAPSTVTVSPEAEPSPDERDRSCLVGDACDDPAGSLPPAELVCSPLPAAMTAFDEQLQAAIPGGDVLDSQITAALGDLTGLVIKVVDQCGYQVMIDIANQYPDPVYRWLTDTAVSALGEISALPAGERCADLKALGLGPKQAVDYWFLWDGPALMDADLDGIPCETVWADVDRYMPPHY
jgi:hypothetical protein